MKTEFMQQVRKRVFVAEMYYRSQLVEFVHQQVRVTYSTGHDVSLWQLCGYLICTNDA